MSSGGMPELGSKISLISKADIRYEGRLFTVDPQECTIALANGEWKTFKIVKSATKTPLRSVRGHSGVSIVRWRVGEYLLGSGES